MNQFRSFLPLFLSLLLPGSGIFLPGSLAAQTPAAKPAQASAAKPAFDVATIKPAAPLDMQRMAADVQAGRMPKMGPEVGATRATYTYMALDQLIALAYNLRAYQVDGPDWLAGDRFDIEATIPEGASKDDAPLMLRALLDERFKLVAHRAQEERKVLALVAGRNGVKMKEAATVPPGFDPDSPLAPGERQIDSPDGPIRMKVSPDGQITMNLGARGIVTQKFDRQALTLHFESSAVTMAGYAEMLSTLLMQMGGVNSRQVVDLTGLKGYYQVDTEISLADMMALARSQGFATPPPPPSGGANSGSVPTASDPSGGTSVFESVEKMGLKLEDRKATVDRLVVDHVEKTPTEN
jgi:uncharacterized protein (TIGR03435 family)